MVLSNFQRKEAINRAGDFAFGAGMALGTERQKPQFQQLLDNLINMTKDDVNMKSLNFDQLAKLTADYTRKRLQDMGDNSYDLDAVGWEMGIFCYAWRNSLAICNNDFNEIFKASWVKYFSM